MNKLSIKFRVTFCYTLLVLMICSTLVGVIALLNENITEKTIYNLLADEVSEKLKQLNSDPVVTLSAENVYVSNGVYIQIYSKNGEMLRGMLPNGFDSRLMPIGDGLITTRSVQDGYMSHCEYSENGDYIVRGIISRKNMHILANTVLKIALFAIPPLILMAFIGGGLIARWAIRPLDRINHTVEEIAGGNDLSKRIGMERESNDEIGTLSRNFDKMMDRLEKVFECEKQFTADASHELRTPVSVILAQCQCALSEGASGADTEAFETIQRQAKKMSTMISKMLSLTRIDRGLINLDVEDIDVSELVNVMCDDISELNPEIELTRTVEPEVHACVDIGCLNMAYENLIINACRYGGDCIHIKLAGKGNKIIFSVTDNGIGIPKDELDKIWNRFYRGSNVTTNSGVGLGLAFVKEAARLHDGEVKVASRVGEGSRFEFIINRKI